LGRGLGDDGVAARRLLHDVNLQAASSIPEEPLSSRMADSTGVANPTTAAAPTRRLQPMYARRRKTQGMDTPSTASLLATTVLFKEFDAATLQRLAELATRR